MRGVVLAGGLGTRLRPLTYMLNKHLLPVYNRPMIDFPIDTLKALGVTDVLLVTGGEYLGKFVDVLGDGSSRGVHITYRVQNEPDGIAGALKLAEGFINQRFYTILGDNYFEKVPTRAYRPTLYTKEVSAERAKRFGVLQRDRVVEKPGLLDGPSKAVTGLYSFDTDVFDFIEQLRPSKREELEITDVNNWYLGRGRMNIVEIEGEWSDMGTFESLWRVASSVRQTT